MDTAFENRILLWVLGVLYVILAGVVTTAYIKFVHRWDSMDIWREAVGKDIASIKVEIEHLREWRHETANDEHKILLQELKELRQAVRKKFREDKES